MSDYHEMLRPVFRIFEALAENQLARLEDGCKAALELEEMLAEIRKPSEEEDGYDIAFQTRQEYKAEIKKLVKLLDERTIECDELRNTLENDPAIEMLQKQLDETTAERDRCIHRIKVLEAGVRVARRALEDAGE